MDFVYESENKVSSQTGNVDVSCGSSSISNTFQSTLGKEDICQAVPTATLSYWGMFGCSNSQVVFLSYFSIFLFCFNFVVVFNKFADSLILAYNSCWLLLTPPVFLTPKAHFSAQVPFLSSWLSDLSCDPLDLIRARNSFEFLRQAGLKLGAILFSTSQVLDNKFLPPHLAGYFSWLKFLLGFIKHHCKWKKLYSVKSILKINVSYFHFLPSVWGGWKELSHPFNNKPAVQLKINNFS